MRPNPASILLLCLCVPVWGATDAARRAQVATATTNAVDAIDHEIGSQPLGSGGTLKDFLQRINSDAALRELLSQSQPVGGPRWLDDQTCQVRIEVEGDKIADWLIAQAKSHPQNSPIDPAALDTMLSDLRTHRFEATSTSAASETVNTLAPASSASSWQNISADQRRQVLLAARQNAAEHALEILGPIEVAEGRTVAEAMTSKPALREQLLGYLRTAPITSVDFQDDLQVHVQLGPSRQELAQTIYTGAIGKTSADLDADDFRGIQALHERITQRLGEVAGSASASSLENTAAGTVPASLIPADPPAWVDHQIDVSGRGFVPGSQLRSAHAAEHDAILNLRTRLGALHLDDSHTVLDAAARDPHVADAINQTLEQARPYKSEFNSDGSVTIHEILDLHDFWQALSGSQ
jgi:hypothetical protein